MSVDRCGVCGVPKTLDSEFEVVTVGLDKEFRCQECYQEYHEEETGQQESEVNYTTSKPDSQTTLAEAGNQ